MRGPELRQTAAPADGRRNGLIERDVSASFRRKFEGRRVEGGACGSDRMLANTTVGGPELGAERFEGGFGGAEEPRSRLGTTFEGRHRAEPHDGLVVSTRPKSHASRQDATRRALPVH